MRSAYRIWAVEVTISDIINAMDRCVGFNRDFKTETATSNFVAPDARTALKNRDDFEIDQRASPCP